MMIRWHDGTNGQVEGKICLTVHAISEITNQKLYIRNILLHDTFNIFQ